MNKIIKVNKQNKKNKKMMKKKINLYNNKRLINKICQNVNVKNNI